MKKIISLLLIATLCLSMSAVSFADTREVDNSVSNDEFDELLKKHNLVVETVDEDAITGAEVISNVTKEELNDLMLRGIEEASKPIYFEVDIDLDEAIKEDIITENNLIPMLNARSFYGWQTIDRVTSLSKTFYSGSTKNFRLRTSVAAGYQFDFKREPGGPGETKNWKFNSVDNGDVVHLNEGAYIMKRVNSKTSYTNTSIKQEYDGILDNGSFIDIKGVTKRVSYGTQPFSGVVNYKKSDV